MWPRHLAPLLLGQRLLPRIDQLALLCHQVLPAHRHQLAHLPLLERQQRPAVQYPHELHQPRELHHLRVPHRHHVVAAVMAEAVMVEVVAVEVRVAHPVAEVAPEVVAEEAVEDRADNVICVRTYS